MASWESFQDFRRMFHRPKLGSQASSEGAGVEAEVERWLASGGPPKEEEYPIAQVLATNDEISTDISESLSITELKDSPRFFLDNRDDGEYVIIASENAELRDLVEEICAQMNIWSSTAIGPGLAKPSLEVPMRLMLLIRHQLQSQLLSDVSADLYKNIKALLGYILSSSIAPRPIGSPEDLFSGSIRTQQAAIARKCVAFEGLIDIFLPGELVYIENPALASSFVFGQCWKVYGCSYETERSQKWLMISGLQWKWDAAESSFILVSAEVGIEEYGGEKQICLEELGLVPLACLEEAKRDALVERLISRGKQYLSLFKSPGRVWQYKGPASKSISEHFSFSSRANLGPVEKDVQRRQMRGNTVIDSRVVLDAMIPQADPDDSESLQVMQLANPIHHETYMIFPVHVWVQLLPGVRDLCTSVYLDFLESVSWETSIPETTNATMCARISFVIKNFDAWARIPTRYHRASTGQIIILRGNMLDMTVIMNEAAEYCQRGLFEIDYFDCREPTKLFDLLFLHMRLALKVNGVVLLQNFEHLVAKRSHEDTIRCNKITEFIELLEVFPGVVCLCLGQGDSVDPKLDKLGPMNFDIGQE